MALAVATTSATPRAFADNASADDATATATATDNASAAADAMLARPIVLARGELDARLVFGAGLPRSGLAHPLSLSPDLYYGITDRLTLGLIHSAASMDLVDARASLCLRGDFTTCDHAYRGSGLDARWLWREGPISVAPRARLLLRDVDPMKPAITIGALARWNRGAFAITSDPYLRLGIANRDRGNRAALVVPIWLAAEVFARATLALHTGWDSELATWRDGWHAPMALEILVRATSQLDIGFSAGFPQAIGPQNNEKERVMTLSVAYRARLHD